jgi:chromosome segregation ATPase
MTDKTDKQIARLEAEIAKLKSSQPTAIDNAAAAEWRIDSTNSAKRERYAMRHRCSRATNSAKWRLRARTLKTSYATIAGHHWDRVLKALFPLRKLSRMSAWAGQVGSTLAH